MKKTMIIGAIALAGVAMGVESKTVGYSQETMASGNFNMIAIPFAKADGKNLSLSDITFENLLEGYYIDGSVDVIEIWNPENNGYTFHYYYTGEGWTDDTGNGYFEDDYPNGLPAGSTAWLEAAPDGDARTAPLTVTYAGSVEDAASVSYDLVSGNFNMLSNPYPVAWNPGDSTVEWTNLLDGYYIDGSVDVIEIWNPANNGYTFHYYYTGEGWTDDTGNGYFADDYPEGLPAGSAFWLEAAPDGETRQGTLSVKFIKPF